MNAMRPPSQYPQNVLDMVETDPQLKAAMPLPDLAELDQEQLSYQQLWEAVFKTYAERPGVGVREYELKHDHRTGRTTRAYLPRFDMISYAEIERRTKGLAAALRRDKRVAVGDFVVCLGFHGIDYMVVDMAIAYEQAVSVPIQSTLTDGDLRGIFEDTAPVAVAATTRDVVLAAKMAAAFPSVRTIIAMDYDRGDDDDREQFEEARAVLANAGARAELVEIGDLIAAGAADEWRPLPPHPQGADRMAMLLHSSGSTGSPKGVIITERIIKAIFGAAAGKAPVVQIQHMPMNHFGGRIAFSGLVRGGTTYITAKPDLSLVFEDIRLVRPTEGGLLPRMLEIVYQHFLTEVTRRSEGGTDDSAIRAQVMDEMRANFLGDRLCSVGIGSAPSTPEMRQFVVDCFQVPLRDGYGLTEAGGGVMNSGKLSRPPITDYKLRDVPELGYYTTDKPYPRGELCLKSSLVSPGYFKKPEATAKLFDAEGWLLTGDIMEERGPDELVYLDRANDVMKLSQGEFVSIGLLGRIFEKTCPVIQQIYVYGNSARSFLLAVVVPDMEVAAARLGRTPEDGDLRAMIRAEMKEAAVSEDLRTFETPRDFIIEHEPFSYENGLLTALTKRRRPALKAKYGDRLEQLYEAAEHKRQEDLASLRDPGANLSVTQKVAKALEAALGVDDIDPDQPYSFGDLGGDSLGASAFAALLADIFGVEVPVGTILSPAGNVRTWARAIEAAQQDRPSGVPTLAQIHGEDRSRLHAGDLDVHAFIDAETLDAAPLDAPGGDVRCVLLTGATGYLGRFLCLEWLERMEAANGKVICLVRAADADSALRRLKASFATDPKLEKRFSTLADKHLEILVSDIAEPRLGLDDAEFSRLGREVDHIVHCGALVNHVLPYSELFSPNVVATAELVRLALSDHQKGFDFISTVGVFAYLQEGAACNEDAPLAESVPLLGRHAEGYASSKWASEQLLRSANKHFHLPVKIFRCDMILTDRRFGGQINVPDSHTRLLQSIVLTGLAPGSFFEPGPDGARQSGHYDGLPVDFIASAITSIGLAASPAGLKTFNVVNHHVDSGVSLDTFVDWISEAGYAIERVADYQSWLQRFEAKLRALPEETRQRSILPVLRSFATPRSAEHRPVGSANFIEAVRQLPEREVPRLDRELLFKSLADMQQLGLIPAP